MTPSQTDVCVVGGGPAGLLLGLLLAKRGARVIVLKGHETFDREFRGEVLQPSTARLLDEIGLLEYILAQPHLTLTTGRLLVNGRPAGGFDFRYIAPEYPYAIWMPQPVFLEALARKAVEFPGFQRWMGARVTELVEDNRPWSASGAGGTARSRSRSGPTWWWAPTAATPRSGDSAGSSPRTSTTISTSSGSSSNPRRTGPRRSTSRWARCRC